MATFDDIIWDDRVRETTTTEGTGNITTAAADTGFIRIENSAIGNGNKFYYVIFMDLSSDWEVGVGTYISPHQFSRSVLRSTNSDAAVNWGPGTKTIICTPPAQWFNDLRTRILAAEAGIVSLGGRSDIMERISKGFSVIPDNPVSMDVTINPGVAPNSNSYEYVASQTLTFTAPSSNPRKDIVWIDPVLGQAHVSVGAESATPSDPSVPVGKIPIARVNLTVSTTEITISDIDDLRDRRMFTGPKNNTGGRTKKISGSDLWKNFLTYSSKFDNAAWTKSNITITPNATASPDGAATADQIVENSASSVAHQLIYNLSGLVDNQQYVGSLWVKQAVGTRLLKLYLSNKNSQYFYGVFNVSTGTLVFTSGDNAGIEDCGDGWYRVWVEFNASSGGASGTMQILTSVSGADAHNGDGASGFYVWGAELRQSSGRPEGFVLSDTYSVTGFGGPYTSGDVIICDISSGSITANMPVTTEDGFEITYLIDNVYVGYALVLFDTSYRTFFHGTDHFTTTRGFDSLTYVYCAATATWELKNPPIQASNATEFREVTTTPVTIGRSNMGMVVRASASASVINFEPSSLLYNGFWIDVVNDTVNDITLDPSGAETINGVSTLTIPSGYSCRVWSNGAVLFTSGWSLKSQNSAGFGWQLYNFEVASSDAEIAFTTGFEAGYDHMFELVALTPSADNQILQARIYSGGTRRTDSNYFDDVSPGTADNAWALASAIMAPIGFNGDFKIIGPDLATANGHPAIGLVTGGKHPFPSYAVSGAGANFTTNQGMRYETGSIGASGYDGVVFYFNAANITSGYINHYRRLRNYAS